MRAGLLALTLAPACWATPADEPDGASAANTEPAAAVARKKGPEPSPAPAVSNPSAVQPDPDPEPDADLAFDAATATEVTVRVSKLVDAGGAPCGIVHSVGAIEVEVLGVVEPPPRLGLYVSCPADIRPRGMLEVGRLLYATLHARKQTWPKPATRLRPDLPIRYVRTLAPVEVESSTGR